MLNIKENKNQIIGNKDHCHLRTYLLRDRLLLNSGFLLPIFIMKGVCYGNK